MPTARTPSRPDRGRSPCSPSPRPRRATRPWWSAGTRTTGSSGRFSSTGRRRASGPSATIPVNRRTGPRAYWTTPWAITPSPTRSSVPTAPACPSSSCPRPSATSRSSAPRWWSSTPPRAVSCGGPRSRASCWGRRSPMTPSRSRPRGRPSPAVPARASSASSPWVIRRRRAPPSPAGSGSRGRAGHPCSCHRRACPWATRVPAASR